MSKCIKKSNDIYTNSGIFEGKFHPSQIFLLNLARLICVLFFLQKKYKNTKILTILFPHTQDLEFKAF